MFDEINIVKKLTEEIKFAPTIFYKLPFRIVPFHTIS